MMDPSALRAPFYASDVDSVSNITQTAAMATATALLAARLHIDLGRADSAICQLA